MRACCGACHVPIVIAGVLTPAMASLAAEPEAESARYHASWAPSRIEVVVPAVDAVSTTEPPDPQASSRTGDVALAVSAAIRDYAASFGIPVAIVPPDAPCPDDGVSVRLVLTLPGELPDGTVPRNGLALGVQSRPDCGFRADEFTRIVDTSGIAGSPAAGDNIGFLMPRAADMVGREILEELVLVWHPVWTPGEESDWRFTDFALEPLDPSPSHGLSFRAAFSKARRIGVNGLIVTPIATSRPAFRWSTLPSLLDRDPGDPVARRAGEIRYEFRLYSARRPKTVLGTASLASLVVPERMLYERGDLTEPAIELPAPLEPCTSYFWTVRARFRLDGFPRVTEWTALHHAEFGIAAPWKARRSENSWASYDPLLAMPAFSTPSSAGRKSCGS
jgi:hypothetical protein